MDHDESKRVIVVLNLKWIKQFYHQPMAALYIYNSNISD